MKSDGEPSNTLPNPTESENNLAFSVFGIPFETAFHVEEVRRHFDVVYHHFKQASGTPRVSSLLHFDVRRGGEGAALEIVVSGAGVMNLSDVFRRGSNRHRFTIVESEDGERIMDRFLGDNWVMTVQGSRCQIRDPDRGAAYAESVVFHTVLSHLPDHYLLHAGVVSRNNNAVILCGNANSGKTTLTMGLVRSGFRFLTDEVALIDPDSSMVLPFPRALGIREKTAEMFLTAEQHALLHPTLALSGDEKVLVDVAQIFPGCLGEACAPSVLLFLEGFASETRFELLRKSEAVLKCLSFAHTAEEDVFKSMMTTSGMVERLQCYRLTLGPVDEVVQCVRDLVAR